jgi:hypothetical protein
MKKFFSPNGPWFTPFRIPSPPARHFPGEAEQAVRVVRRLAADQRQRGQRRRDGQGPARTSRLKPRGRSWCCGSGGEMAKDRDTDVSAEALREEFHKLPGI